MIEPATTPALHAPARPISPYFWKSAGFILTCACFVTILAGFVYYLLGSHPFWGLWEDSFMLVRYANNLLHGSGLIWNPGGEPTYGLTSLFYVAPVSLIQAIVPHKPILSLALTSFLCGCLFLLLSGVLLRPFFGTNKTVDLALKFLLLVSFARASPYLAVHFWSGMDTMFVLSMMTIYLLIARWQERENSWASTVVLGISGALMYGVRPDLLIYTFLVPAAVALLGKDKVVRVKGWVALAITVCTTALLLLALYLYFGTPVPLPFYAKAMKLYGDFEYEHYRKVPFQQFADYFRSYCLCFGIIVIDLFDRLESRAKPRLSPFYIALLCGTILFCIYYLFFVLQIMEFSSRFYYPTLPALLWLSATATRRLVEKYADWFRQLFAKGTGWGWAAALAAAGVILIAPPLFLNIREIVRVPSKGIVSWDQGAEFRTYWYNGWFRLDRFSALPDDLTMATTEIGHVGAMNLGKVVVDMAGLNERGFAKHPFSADTLFRKYAPDLIYMPHPGYRSLNRELLENPEFVRNYEYFPPAKLDPTLKFGIALRRDSKYYPRMRAIAVAPN